MFRHDAFMMKVDGHLTKASTDALPQDLMVVGTIAFVGSGAMAASLIPYLPRLVRYWDEDAPGQLHRSIEGSMVFVDISGFTKMSERLARHGRVGAEEVTEVIDNTFGQLLPAAYAYGANLLKFGGDALLLLFTGAGHAHRACAAGWAMRKELRAIGSFATTAGQVTLRMSVGVHSGQFDFFLVGGSHRELMVAGPAATRTVEMESAATAGQILISPETAAALPRRNQGYSGGTGVLLRGEVDAERLGFGASSFARTDLAAFVPTALRQVLVNGEAEPEHRPATLAFVQYRRFDRLISREGAKKAARYLDRVIGAVQEATDRYEVTFLGTDIAADGGKIILVSGAPTATGNDEERMLLAVRQIASADLTPPLSIGVNWGSIFAGELGPHYRRTYTAMGDTVNLAARLMARAEIGQVLTTREVLDGSRTLFETEELEPFSVKGKRRPVTAYVLGQPAGSRVGGMGVRLVGRERDLEQLLETWDWTRTKCGHLVEVVAEPGMGKSRLLEEFLDRVPAEARVLRAECRLYQTATPYFPFRALLGQALAIDAQGANDAIGQLRRLITRVAPELRSWLPLIAVPLNLNVPDTPEVARLDPQFRPARTVEAVRALLERTIAEPTIIVVEDTHWIDEASRDLLQGLLASSAANPWMVVVSRRPGEGNLAMDDPNRVSQIELEPLALEDAERLIIAATEDNPLPAQRVRSLAMRAAGNPLFLVELLAALGRGDNIESLPQSVEGLIGARIDRLPSQDRTILRRLAVLGAGFQLEHVEAVLPQVDQSARIRSIHRMNELLSVGETGWVQFRHALIRDVAYGSLPFTTRRGLHAQVGESIERAAGDQVEARAELLSFHFSQAQEFSRAWRYSLIAGRRAAAVYANTEAASFLQRGLEAGPRKWATAQELAEAYELLGDVEDRRGEFGKAVEAYSTARKLMADQPLAAARMFDKQSLMAEKSGNFSQALRWLTRSLNLLGGSQLPDGAGMRAKLMGGYGAVRLEQGKLREAITWTRRAIDEAQLAGEKAALAQAYLTLDIALTELGEEADSPYATMALALFEELEDLAGQANVLNNMGAEAYWKGRWDEARQYFQRSQDARERMGDELNAADGVNNVAEILSDQGRLEEAGVLFHDTLRVRQAYNHRIGLAYAWSNLGRVAYRSGRNQEAMSLLEKARREFASLGMSYELLETDARIAECYLFEGQWRQALDLADRTLTEAGQHGGTTAQAPMLHRLRGWAYLIAGRYSEAEAEFATSLRHGRARYADYEVALTLDARAGLARIMGDRPDPADMQERDAIIARLGVVFLPSPVVPTSTR